MKSDPSRMVSNVCVFSVAYSKKAIFLNMY